MKLRIARATNDLARISKMYSEGLGLEILGSFVAQSGFDGNMLGSKSADYHFEFTYEHDRIAPHSNSPETLIIFYVADVKQCEERKAQMLAAGFKLVKSHNPYWDQHGYTLEDFEGYRVVLCHRQMSDLPWPRG